MDGLYSTSVSTPAWLLASESKNLSQFCAVDTHLAALLLLTPHSVATLSQTTESLRLPNFLTESINGDA